MRYLRLSNSQAQAAEGRLPGAGAGAEGGGRGCSGPQSLSSERRQSSAVCPTATCTCDVHKAGLCVQAFVNYISLYALFTTIKNNLAIPMENTQKVGKKPLTRLCGVTGPSHEPTGGRNRTTFKEGRHW